MADKNILEINYHTQRNNKILPYSTCGVTVMAMYISYLNKTFGKNYECDDDKLMIILNSDIMIQKAKELIKLGKLDASALEVRKDNEKTKDVDESKFHHFNNFKEMLVELGNYVTNKEFNFKIEYLTPEQIKGCIDEGFPVELSAKFTSGGHFVLINGYDTTKNNWIVNDPYGDWNFKYDPNKSGSNVYYDVDKVNSIFTFKKGNALQCIRAYRI